jgi:hypothetical protein
MTEPNLDELAEALAEFDAPQREGAHSARDERIIAGFEEVQRFVSEHGRKPQQGEERDIFERIYAVRLERLRAQSACRAILADLDHQGLLEGAENDPSVSADIPDLDELAAALEGADGGADVGELRYVRSAAEKRVAEEVAGRDPCADFDQFKPLFDRVANDLATGARISRQIRKDAGFLKSDIKEGEFFIVGGQTVYVAEVGEPLRAPNGDTDARLRVIYSNGTESNLLLRSLQRAIYKDDTSRRISEPDAGPLFADEVEDEDLPAGYIYVLRSQSQHPTVTQHRKILHKIGVTGGDVKKRIAGAKLDPTFLMADVEIVATYELFNINRSKLENIIHRVFGRARLQIDIRDRFGNPVVPKEWFLVPVFVINEAVERIKDGSITDFEYDPASASLVRTSSPR